MPKEPPGGAVCQKDSPVVIIAKRTPRYGVVCPRGGEGRGKHSSPLPLVRLKPEVGNISKTQVFRGGLGLAVVPVQGERTPPWTNKKLLDKKFRPDRANSGAWGFMREPSKGDFRNVLNDLTVVWDY